jgi:oligopeptide transport system substrate-binding protein
VIGNEIRFYSTLLKYGDKMINLPMRYISILIASSLLYGCAQENSASPSDNTSSLSEKVARIATDSDPLSLDPRLIRELGSINIMNALFEGLMRMDSNQQPQFGIAKSVEISPDLLTYTFTLRESNWSDGTPLTAADFAETWKSILNPNFPAPNAYMLYAIKGAKEAKEGQIPPDAIGVKATSPTTLVVQLEQPLPYFLKLLSSHLYFPVNTAMRNQSSNHFTSSPEKLVSNGPFSMRHWKQRNEVFITKNPHYWDAESVSLHGIAFQILDENTALQLFKGNKLDWAGSPISVLPQDAILSLKGTGGLKTSPAAGTHWLRFNTQKAPFNNLNMRAAFNSAIDRKALVEHITQGNQLPATGVVPPSFGMGKKQYYKDHDTLGAQKYYMTALIDLRDAAEKLPEISLCYSGNDRNRKIAQAIQQQWNKAFGINVVLEGCESQVFYERLRTGNYQLSLGSWYADVLDPINFLELFKSKDNATNNTYWENEKFAQLLEMSSHESSPEERNQLLSQAEAVLMQELPVAPLFYGSFNYLTSPRLEGVELLETGVMNFHNASIKE